MRATNRTTALGRYALLEAEGEYFDGLTARPREVIVKFGESSLTLFSLDDTPIAHWALASVRAIGGAVDDRELRLTPDAEGDERLTVRDPAMIDAIRAVCADLDRPYRAPGTNRRLLFWAAAAIGAVALIVLVLVPSLAERLAPLIPAAQEERLGASVARNITRLQGGAAAVCESPDGSAALDRMVARLSSHVDSYVPLKVQVVDVDVPNAFAAPGGYIIVFRGLIAQAAGPEEVAGVLAHEIGHVVSRDPTRSALRTAGSAGVLGLLVGDFAGGAMLVAMTEAVLNASYSQEAESQADDTAYRIFSESGLPSSALAAFFDRLRREHGDVSGLMTHIASHPDLRSRAEKARAADTIGEKPYQPVLDDADWIALQQICD